ncbi:MAG: hydroxyethylthiazole kinase [Bradyrhizobiaceae bacterium]|nr:hydroxyethylthiazole kinase [Bradyrhizobiaceae bacterium]
MTADLVARAASLVAQVRERRPRVHCITNTVVQELTANVLLAAGAIPSMTTSPEEIGYFVSGADVLLVNLGTLDKERRDAIEIALEVARDDGIPWVLDPVLIERSEPRAELARLIAMKEPRVVRGNAAEFGALTNAEPTPEALDKFALDHITVAACTGAVDLVTSGAKRVQIENGHPYMAQVTGIGCAESALVAAMVAVEDDEFIAATAGLLLMGIAGETAAEIAQGPGSFAVALIDALAKIAPGTIAAKARVR